MPLVARRSVDRNAECLQVRDRISGIRPAARRRRSVVVLASVAQTEVHHLDAVGLVIVDHPVKGVSDV